MNKTQYGNIAIGQEGSIARYKADIEYLTNKLKLMEYAADELRDFFVPNDETHSAIQAYNEAKNYKGGQIDLQVMPKFMKTIEEWEETMTAHIEDAIDKQEQQISEHYYKGREDAAKYAIEMIHKHLKLNKLSA